MKIKYFLTVYLVLFSCFAKAQEFSLYKKEIFVRANDTLPYRILLPENYDPQKKYPLILFLHGSGERGNDNELQLVHGAKLFLQDSARRNYPAIIVFPQCSQNSYWSNVDFKEKNGKRTFDFSPAGEPTIAMRLAEKLLEQLMQQFKVNKKQVYVMGLSMGGMGAFEIVRRNPKLFAAAVPICGGANTSTAKQLKKTNWWIFHGVKDDVVNPEFSIQMADALKKEKAKFKLTLYPNASHNSWDNAFTEPQLLQWLFAQHK